MHTRQAKNTRGDSREADGFVCTYAYRACDPTQEPAQEAAKPKRVVYDNKKKKKPQQQEKKEDDVKQGIQGLNISSAIYRAKVNCAY